MNMNKTISLFLLALLCSVLPTMARERVYKGSDLGLHPNTGKSQSAAMKKAIETIRTEMGKGDKATLRMPPVAITTYPTTTSPSPVP